MERLSGNFNEEKNKLIMEIQKKQEERKNLRKAAALQSLVPVPGIKFQGKAKLSAMDYEDYQKGKISMAKLIGKNALRYLPFVGIAADTVLDGTSSLVSLTDFSSEQLADMDIEQLKQIYKGL